MFGSPLPNTGPEEWQQAIAFAYLSALIGNLLFTLFPLYLTWKRTAFSSCAPNPRTLFPCCCRLQLLLVPGSHTWCERSRRYLHLCWLCKEALIVASSSHQSSALKIVVLQAVGVLPCSPLSLCESLKLYRTVYYFRFIPETNGKTLMGY